MSIAVATQKHAEGEMPPETEESVQATSSPDAPRIEIIRNGPYRVSGAVSLVEEAIVPEDGHLEYRHLRTLPIEQTYALCRCGRTTTPPFCDGSHREGYFDGTETASRRPFADRAEITDGEGVYLLDDNRCSYARFCHREDGDVWTLTERSGNERLKGEAIKASSDCPAGRLVHYDTHNGSVYERNYQPSIVILQDPSLGVGGPLFVRGGIPLIGADGRPYETRNRYTLCRCGSSHNKPFCDAMHVTVGFESTFED